MVRFQNNELRYLANLALFLYYYASLNYNILSILKIPMSILSIQSYLRETSSLRLKASIISLMCKVMKSICQSNLPASHHSKPVH